LGEGKEKDPCENDCAEEGGRGVSLGL